MHGSLASECQYLVVTPGCDIGMSLEFSRRVVAKRATWKFVGLFAEDGLFVGLGSAQGVETDEVVVQEDFGPDQSPYPTRIHHEGASEELDRSTIVGASQEDHSAVWMRLEIESPRIGKESSRRSGIDAQDVSASRGEDVAYRSLLEFAQRGGLKAMDDFGLPESVEGFDGGLEAGFTRRSEDRSNAEGQAKPDDASEGIGDIMGSLEAGVVVELGISGQAVVAPVELESGKDEVGGDVAARPGRDKPAMQGDGIEGMSVVSLE